MGLAEPYADDRAAFQSPAYTTEWRIYGRSRRGGDRPADRSAGLVSSL